MSKESTFLHTDSMENYERLHVHVCITYVLLSFQQVKARGNVENWLGLVEDSMVVSLRKLTKASLADFETKPRHIWATQHASQVIPYINTYITNFFCSFSLIIS